MDSQNWYALYTKSRHEKLVTNELAKNRIVSFLPELTIRRKWSDRTVTIQEPLFKSYVFVKADARSAQEALKARGAVRFVTAGSKPVPIQESVIQALQTAVSQNISIDPFPYLTQGDRVYVRSGVFKGTEGFIVRKDEKKCRLVISIDAIMSSISLEIDASVVEKI